MAPALIDKALAAACPPPQTGALSTGYIWNVTGGDSDKSRVVCVTGPAPAPRAYLAEQVALGEADILQDALLLRDGHLRSGHTRETR